MNSSSSRPSRLPTAGEVDRLAAGHAARAGGDGELVQHRELVRRLGAERTLGEHLEGQRLQRVAGEQGGGLVELDMHGRFAAAQHVIVHARKVVVHQRIGVDQLDRAGDAVEVLGRGTGECAGRMREQRAHALAAPSTA